MSRSSHASTSDSAANLLKKALLLASTFGMFTLGSTGSHELTKWGSLSTMVGQRRPGFADFQSSSTLSSEANPAIGIARASEELGIVLRVLAAIKVDLDPYATAYLDRLVAVFDFADARGDQLEHVAPALVAYLRTARIELLEAAPTARHWTLLARAMDPDASLRIPRRFIRSPVSHSHGIDLDQIEAAAWARTVTAT